MIFDWQFAWSVLPVLLKATVVTLQATFIGMGVALLLGLVLALARHSPRRLLAWPAGALVEFIRSTPLLVQLFFLFYVLPNFGLVMSPFVTGVIGLGLHYSAYTSEVYRSGLDGVPRGQWEAALALNFTPSRTLWAIVLPQALPPIVPALGNYWVAMFKETPQLSAITVLELLGRAKIIGSEEFRYLEPLTLVGLLFLVMSLCASVAIRQLERRLSTTYDH